MSEEIRFIDPYSHPDNEELTLTEAANLAHQMFTEHGTGQTTGVRNIGIGKDRLFFYVKSKRHAVGLPKFFRGHPCEVRVAGEARPLVQTS